MTLQFFKKKKLLWVTQQLKESELPGSNGLNRPFICKGIVSVISDDQMIQY